MSSTFRSKYHSNQFEKRNQSSSFARRREFNASAEYNSCQASKLLFLFCYLVSAEDAADLFCSRQLFIISTACEPVTKSVIKNKRWRLLCLGQNGNGGGNSVSDMHFRDPYTTRS